MRHLFRLNHYIRPYRKQFALAWLSVILSASFVMVSPLLVRYAVQFGLKPVYDASGDRVVGLDGNERLLIFSALAIVACAIGRGIAQFGQQYLGESLGQKVAYDIRNDIYTNLQRLSYAYHDNAQTGQIMSRVTQDVEGIRMYINMGLVGVGYVVLILASAGVGRGRWELALCGSAVPPPVATCQVAVRLMPENAENPEISTW